MKKVVILKPKINSKFHFGNLSLEESENILHSNSLFSAIVNNYVKLYGEDDLNSNIKNLKEIKLSSLLYKIKNIYLIPKPEHPRFYILKEKVNGVRPKDIKKIQFFSIKAYRDLLDGNLQWTEENLKDIIDHQTINKSIVISKNEIEEIKKIFGIKAEKLKHAKISIISEQIEQKVAIDRLKETTLKMEGRGQLYNIEFIKLNENVEFYFLIDYKGDREFIKKLEASIKLIEDEGLGGKRSIGAGFFEKVEIIDLPKDFNEILDENSKYHHNLEYKMLLGVGIPDKDDVKNIEYYKLIEIGGYIHSTSILTKPSNNLEKGKKALTTPKRNILALTEGSIVKNDFKGKVEEDLAPEGFEHKVYAHGKPILMPFGLKGDNNGS